MCIELSYRHACSHVSTTTAYCHDAPADPETGMPRRQCETVIQPPQQRAGTNCARCVAGHRMTDGCAASCSLCADRRCGPWECCTCLRRANSGSAHCPGRVRLCVFADRRAFVACVGNIKVEYVREQLCGHTRCGGCEVEQEDDFVGAKDGYGGMELFKAGQGPAHLGDIWPEEENKLEDIEEEYPVEQVASLKLQEEG